MLARETVGGPSPDPTKTDIFGVDFTGANLLNANLELDEVFYASYAIFCTTTMPKGDANDDDCPA